MHGLVERFQGPLAADGIAEEHREKVEHVVASEPSSRKTHLLADLVQEPLFTEMGGHHSDFAQPGRSRTLRV